MCSLFLITGCEEDNAPLVYPPTLVTGQVEHVTRFEAELQGTAVPNPASAAKCDIGFMVSTSQSMTDATTYKGVETGNNQYTVQANGLKPGGQYYFCLYAQSGNTIVKSEPQKFTTEESIPPVLKEPVIDGASESSVTVTSEIVDNGGYEPSIKGFAYKKFVEGDSDPTTDDKTVLLPIGATEFSAVITDLDPSTTYVIRAYATTETGTGYSESINITTDKLNIPILSIGTVSQLTAYTATVTATVTDDQGFDITEQGLCWSAESRQPTIDGKHITVAGTESPFTGTAGSDENDRLQPHTKYYLRAYAVNEKGKGYSPVIEFTTEELEMVSLTRLIISELTISSATITAQVEYGETTSVTETGICWSETTTSPTKNDHIAKGILADKTLTANIEGLAEGHKYYATAYAVTRDGYFYSEPIEFNTEKTSTPAMTTPAASDIEETSSTITASITSNGGSAVITKGVCWSSTNKEPSLEDTNTSHYLPASDSGNGITCELKGLTKGTKYFVRAYATNKNGTNYSATAEFTTAETFAPTVSTPTISETTESSGKVTAKVTSDGGAELTETGICYSIDKPEPTINDGKAAMQKPSENIGIVLTGLTKGKLYYVRAYATNRNGTSYSVTGELRTSQNQAPTLTSITVMNINDDNALGKAFISDNGGKEMTITTKGFVWSIGNASIPTLENCTGSMQSTSSGNSFEGRLENLQYRTDYSVRAYATNNEGLTGYSDPIGFQSGYSELASISRNNEQTYVSKITGTGATVHALIEGDGGATITKVGICWGSEYDPVKKEGHYVETDYTDNEFSLAITGLTHETNYNARAYAINKNGISYGNNLSFTTDKLPPSVDDNLPPGTVTGKKPTMGSIYSSGIFSNRLELTATIYDDGGLPISAKGFVWSETDYDPQIGDEGCTQVPITTSGNEMKLVLRDLKPGTTYYISAYATNEKGTSYTRNSFTTEANKPEPDEGDNPTPGTDEKR